MWVEVLVNEKPRLINFDKVFQVFTVTDEDSKVTLEFQDKDFLTVSGPYERYHKLLLDKRKTGQTITIGG